METRWLDRTEYPFQSNYLLTEGHRLHYIDEGAGETLLFVHGTPSWSFDFRHVISTLKKFYRCVAIDHIGFGLSDKPARYDYSTPNHSRTLERFVQAKQLGPVTLVMHDFGGPIGLDFAMRHPGQVRRLVILNSWLWSSRSDPEFARLSKLLNSPLLPFLYRYLNFSPRCLMPRSFGDRKPDRHQLSHYTRPFADHTQRNGPLAFARSLLSDQEWFQALWEKKQVIADKPTLFIWGMKDPMIKPHYLAIFESGFPNSATIRLDTAGHFPQEEQPQAVSDAILVFLAHRKNQT